MGRKKELLISKENKYSAQNCLNNLKEALKALVDIKKELLSNKGEALLIQAVSE